MKISKQLIQSTIQKLKKISDVIGISSSLEDERIYFSSLEYNSLQDEFDRESFDCDKYMEDIEESLNIAVYMKSENLFYIKFKDLKKQ